MEDQEIGDHLSSGIMKLMERAATILDEASESRPEWVEGLVSAQVSAAERRKELDSEGVHVPAFMIVSVTRRCNLNCSGCYARKLHSGGSEEMSDALLKKVLSEARGLGISIVLTAGGEPLMRPGIINILKSYPEVLFPLFTNGLLLDERTLLKLHNARNIVPILSMEGFEEDTDLRRGDGVFRRLKIVLPVLSTLDIFWGISITVSSDNFEVVTGREFIKELIDSGCRLFFYVEYIPVEDGTEQCAPTPEQRGRLIGLMKELKDEHPGLFITFPGDEEALGGCLSSGRGFFHVNPSGGLEPCPFAPYSDTDLNETSMREALGSRLLARIRENHDMLSETRGGCALWQNREWVRGLLK